MKLLRPFLSFLPFTFDLLPFTFDLLPLTFHLSPLAVNPFPFFRSPRISSHSAGFFQIQEKAKLSWNCRNILLSIFQTGIFLTVSPEVRQMEGVDGVKGWRILLFLTNYCL
jgi:hypothetical protein